MHLRYRAGVVSATLVLCGCASAGTPTSHHSANTITQQEIDAYDGANVYLLIQSLHANWMRVRGPESMRGSSAVVVYIDGMPQPDGVESLKQFRPREVEEITYLDSREATNRFGTGHTNGAILVKLRGGPGPEGAP